MMPIEAETRNADSPWLHLCPFLAAHRFPIPPTRKIDAQIRKGRKNTCRFSTDRLLVPEGVMQFDHAPWISIVLSIPTGGAHCAQCV